MSLSDWLVLSLHIIIPSIIAFLIIYYSWRFIVFLRLKFNQFRQKVDGYDQIKTSQKRHSSHRKSHKNHPRQAQAKRNNSTPENSVTVTTTGTSYDGNADSVLGYIHIHEDDQSAAIAGIFDVEKGYRIFEEEGLESFTDWYMGQIDVSKFRKSIYVSLTSIDEQFYYHENALLNPRTKENVKRMHFWLRAYFIELKIREKYDFLTWEKKNLQDQTYVKLSK